MHICGYLHFDFADIFWDIFSSRCRVKNLFFSIKQSNLRSRKCLLWGISFCFTKVVVFIFLYWDWLWIVSSLSPFSQRTVSTYHWFTFPNYLWTRSTKKWLSSTSIAQINGFVSCINFVLVTKCLSNVVTYFFFHSKGLITWWSACKRHCLTSVLLELSHVSDSHCWIYFNNFQ